MTEVRIVGRVLLIVGVCSLAIPALLFAWSAVMVAGNTSVDTVVGPGLVVWLAVAAALILAGSMMSRKSREPNA